MQAQAGPTLEIQWKKLVIGEFMRNWALRIEDYNIMQNNAFKNQDWQWNLPKSDGKDPKECFLLAELANNNDLACILK